MNEPKKRNTGKIVGTLVSVLVLSCCCFAGAGKLGYDSFQRYIARSRLSEPRFELRNIAGSEEAYCEMNGSYAPAAGPQPLTHGGTERAMGDFTGDPGFRAIGYEAYGPLYFSYSIVPAAMGHIEIRATGDADGDGETSTHTIACVPDGCDCAETPTSSGDADERLDG